MKYLLVLPYRTVAAFVSRLLNEELLTGLNHRECCAVRYLYRRRIHTHLRVSLYFESSYLCLSRKTYECRRRMYVPMISRFGLLDC